MTLSPQRDMIITHGGRPTRDGPGRSHPAPLTRYGSGGEDDNLSRVQDFKFTGDASPAVDHRYFGLAGFATVNYRQDSNL
jgi:hypothetical protein